jgi:hypothetical protein
MNTCARLCLLFCLAAGVVSGQSVTTDAVPSASYTHTSDSATAFNDGALPASSDDRTIRRHTWWNHLGGYEWAQYDFPKPVEVSSVAVYWYDDSSRGGGCRVPRNWSLVYKDGDEWKPVENPSKYDRRTNQFNRVTFKAVTCKALRINVELEPRASGGILEWGVNDSHLVKTEAVVKVKLTADAASASFFEEKVHPILKSNCFECHGAKSKVEGGLRLTSREALLKGADTGPVINLAKPSVSYFLEMLSYKDDEHEMPPAKKGKLSDADIATLTEWVKMGVPWSDKIKAPNVAEVDLNDPTQVNERSKQYWAYQKIKRPDLPSVKNKKWVKSPIDAFVMAKLESGGLQPADAIDRSALIRRAYYDLIGLPPSPAEVDAFVNDKSDDAFAKVVDHLLASPHYGEKWGRHWLDLVRFAESHGYERDSTKPMAWGYREYVINALNEDKGYDQFLIEQLAGDEIENPTPASIRATGYYRLGIWDDEPADRKLAKFDVLDGVLDVTGRAMLGMSIGCARCHNHRIDPLPQSDYYSMLSFFINVRDMNKQNLVDIKGHKQQELAAKKQAEKDAKEAKIHNQIFALQQEFVAQASRNHEIMPAGVAVSPMVEMEYKFYRDTWTKLPNFDDLRHENDGTLAANLFSLTPASRKDAMGFVFEGKIKVDKDGEHSFILDTQDGSRLLINGKTVVEYDGLNHRAGKEKVGKVQLKKGLHPIRLEYFSKTTTNRLKVLWSGPDFSRVALSDEAASQQSTAVSDSRKVGQKWRYSFNRPSGAWKGMKFDDKGWKIGVGGFGTRGTPGSVVRTEWKTKDIWMRRTVTMDTPVSNPTLVVNHDEDVEVYVNNRLVFKETGHIGKYKMVNLQNVPFKKGENLIAVYCRQTSGGQYVDVGFQIETGTMNVVELMKKHGRKVLGQDKFNQYNNLNRQLTASRKQTVTVPGGKAMAVQGGKGGKTFIFRRGNPNLVGAEVQPGFPTVLTDEKPTIVEPKHGGTSGRRLALAKWIASADNPLTSRVIMNRLWQHHFGRGIVRMTSDFGNLAEPPTHPQFLDWLASELVANDWSLKAMHRTMMLTSTYQMSSRAEERALAQDPRNDLMWRYNMRRLTAEELRDSLINASGHLNTRVGGESFFPVLPQEVMATSSKKGRGGHWGNSKPEDLDRRAIYIFIRRSLQDPLMEDFDRADTDSPCAVRFSTTVPNQALNMLNSKFVNDQAVRFADRLRSLEGVSTEERVAAGIEIALARKATKEDIEWGMGFLQAIKKTEGVDDKVALDRLALLILNLNEFVYID